MSSSVQATASTTAGLASLLARVIRRLETINEDQIEELSEPSFAALLSRDLKTLSTFNMPILAEHQNFIAAVGDSFKALCKFSDNETLAQTPLLAISAAMEPMRSLQLEVAQKQADLIAAISMAVKDAEGQDDNKLMEDVENQGCSAGGSAQPHGDSEDQEGGDDYCGDNGDMAMSLSSGCATPFCSSVAGKVFMKRTIKGGSFNGRTRQKQFMTCEDELPIADSEDYRVHLAHLWGDLKCKGCQQRKEVHCVVPYGPNTKTQTCRGCAASNRVCEYAGGSGPTIDLRILAVVGLPASRPTAKHEVGSAAKRTARPTASQLNAEVSARVTRSLPKSSSPEKTEIRPSLHAAPKRLTPVPNKPSTVTLSPPPILPDALTISPPIAGPLFPESRAPDVEPSSALSMHTLSSIASWMAPVRSSYLQDIQLRLISARQFFSQTNLDHELAQSHLERTRATLELARRDLRNVERALHRESEHVGFFGTPAMVNDLVLRNDPDVLCGIVLDEDDEEAPASSKGKDKGTANKHN